MFTKKLLLAVPPCVVAIIDASVTLLDQPQSYWSHYDQHSEANPLSAWLLAHGPVAFALGKLVYYAVILLLVGALPGILSLLCAGSFLVGHAFGLLTWLLFYHNFSFYWIYAYFPAVTAAVIWQTRYHDRLYRAQV